MPVEVERVGQRASSFVPALPWRSCALATQLRGAKILQPMMTTCNGSGTPTLLRLSRPNWLLSPGLEPCFRSLILVRRYDQIAPKLSGFVREKEAWYNCLGRCLVAA